MLNRTTDPETQEILLNAITIMEDTSAQTDITHTVPRRAYIFSQDTFAYKKIKII